MIDKIDKICVEAGIPFFCRKTKIEEVLCEFTKTFHDGQAYVLWPNNASSQILQKLSGGGLNVEADIAKDAKLINHTFKRKYKILINSSYSSNCLRRGVRNFCLMCINRCKVIDIYKLLYKRGVPCNKELICELRRTYTEIIEDLNGYEALLQSRAKDNSAIKKLIEDYLAIRDFNNAFIYIDKLKDMEDVDALKYSNLKSSIEEVLSELEDMINKKEHIVINWLDALRYDEMENMCYLKELSGKGICFDNMYTSTAYTSATAKTMFTGKLLIEDNLYRMPLEDCESSKLYKTLQDADYEFLYIGSKLKKGIFKNESMEIEQLIYDKEEMPVSMMLYELIHSLARAQKKCFAIVHSFSETHWPYMNPVNTDTRMIDGYDTLRLLVEHNRDIMNQVIASQKYLDEQLKFYHRFYSNIAYNIYMSDHGSPRSDRPICFREMNHIVFLVLGNEILPRRVPQVTSLLGFSRMVEHLINKSGNEIGKTDQEEYAMIQHDDPYGGNIKYFLDDPKDYKMHLVQRRGVITEKDFYVRYLTGEEYYVLKDGDENLVGCKEYSERIDYLRKITGKQFINIEKENKYRVTYELYRKLGYEIDKNIEFVNEN